ncbi:MAG: hypothetical protein ACO3G4_02530 [Opitutaceae bacterium]
MRATPGSVEEPGWSGVAWAAAGAVALGLGIAALVLGLRPVPAGEGPVAGTARFVAGSVDAERAREAPVRRESLRAGQDVTFTEPELNALLVRPSARAAPNVRQAGGGGQLARGVAGRGGRGGARPGRQARAEPVRAGAGWALQAREVYLGGLALHRLPVLAEVAWRESLEPLLPAELRAALPGARELEVAGATLRLRRP